MRTDDLRPEEKELLALYRAADDSAKKQMVVLSHSIAGKPLTPLMQGLLEAQAALAVAA